MSDIRIITDSAADIPQEFLAECPEVVVLNIPMVVDGQPKREGVDFTTREFYDILANAAELPTTSQVTMMEYQEEYARAFTQGVEHLIVVTITGKASNMYNAACMARDNLWEEQPATKAMTIDVVDSREYTFLYGNAVLEGVKMIRSGADYTQVVNHLSTIPERTGVSFAIYKLDYAKRSGRISPAAAFAGELMGLRPIMSIIDGEVKIPYKVRGDKQAVKKMVDLFEQEAEPDAPYTIMWATNREAMEDLRDTMIARGHTRCRGIHHIGAAITTNSGPTLVGMFYNKKQ
jgi:DegV family protein with EDD domain